MLVCVLVAVFGAAAVSGCTNPDWGGNAFVVHVVAPTCEDVSTLEPLLVIEKSVGSFGKSSRTEWRSFQRLEGCGEPFEGHPWSGGVLQVWVTDYEWHRNQPTRVQMGHRVNDADTWAIGDDDGMRVDHRHIFLGTIDVGVPGGAYLPPDAIDAAVTPARGPSGLRERSHQLRQRVATRRPVHIRNYILSLTVVLGRVCRGGRS